MQELVDHSPELDNDLEAGEPLVARTPGSRRWLASLTAGTLLAAIAVTAGLWIHFHSTHIVTSNALVRANLSELGVHKDGLVARMHVDAGDQVVKGQLLAELDASLLQARRASVEATMATLDERIALAETRLALESTSAVINTGFTKPVATGSTREALSVQQAELRVLQTSRAQVEAELALVDADIAGTRIYAPADGAIVRRIAQPGMSVGIGNPILSLWLTDSTWVEAWIPEADLADVAPGMQVQIRFPAIPGERFEGLISRIGLATDYEMPADYLPQTRESRMRPTPQIGLEILLESPPARFRPGLSAVVDIQREAG